MPVSGRKFCRMLEKDGWTLTRIRGSHRVYDKPGEVISISVPVHANTALKKGLLLRLAKEAGIKVR